MPWPYNTYEKLVAAGYQFLQTRRCVSPACRQLIEMWMTPNAKRIPLNAGTLDPHHETCKDVKFFRRKPASESQEPKRETSTDREPGDETVLVASPPQRALFDSSPTEARGKRRR